MNKRYYILLSICIFLSFLAWITSKPSTSQPTVIKHPVFWINNAQLVLLKKHSIVLKDYKNGGSETIAVEFSETEKSTSQISTWSCFSDKKWILRGSHRNPNGTSGGATFYSIGLKNGQIISKDKPAPVFLHSYNRFDCEHVTPRTDYDEEMIASTRSGFSDVPTRKRNDLFSKRDVISVRSGADFGSKIFEITSPNGLKRLELNLGKGRGWHPKDWAKSVRDRSAPSYLIFKENSRDFGHPDRIPKTIWKMDTMNGTTQTINLPTAPWLGKYHEKEGCFSCGCGCYRKLDYYLVGNKIYGHTWGYGFPAWAQGIYELDISNEDSLWGKVVGGVVARHLAFSPDGCKMAFASPDLNVKNLCESI